MAYITLNKKHFFHNLDIIANQTKSKDKIALVLKDNAYGHGLIEIATMAQEYGITKAVVRCDYEAQRIKKFFPYILVLASIPQKADETICYTINDIGSIKQFPQGTKVELKVDTGMNRNGIEKEELSAAFASIVEAGLHLEAVFTHHSSADEEGVVFQEQENLFATIQKEALALAQQYKITTLRFHSANSAALFRQEKTEANMVRVGIAAYGCLTLPSSMKTPPLQPVLSLYGEKLSSRIVYKGECVGYSATFQAPQKCSISTYDIGYGDGFLRSCSNHYIAPYGEEIVGRISMDNSSFISSKKELLIFNDAREAAAYGNTIAYEMLTSLKGYIPRRIV